MHVQSLFDYMEVFYNRQRRHSTINYVAPLAFEESTNAWSDCPPFVGNIRSSHSGGHGSVSVTGHKRTRVHKTKRPAMSRAESIDTP